MKFSKIKKDYFIFSKKERNASVVLIIIIVIVIIFPPLQNLFATKAEPVDYDQMYAYFNSASQTANEDEPVMDEIKPDQKDFLSHEDVIHIDRKLFYFNPNTITEEEWLQLGIKPSIAQRIIHYREKGGVFKTKTDLLKTYGFSQADYDALEEYILIPSDQPQFNSAEEQIIFQVGERQITDINVASADDLNKLGFAKDLSVRIYNYIKGLGGIYAVEQLKSVYGINEAQLEEITPYLFIDPGKIQLININLATENELAKHMYISDELAKEIINYRDNTGRFVSVSELMKVKGMYPALFEKLKPYLII